MDIFKGVSAWILSKNRCFSSRGFSQKLCQKRSFFDILDRKQSFFDQTIEVLTGARKWTLFKPVSPWILSKNRTFSDRCFSQELCHKRSCFDILDRKQSFLDQKIEVLTRTKKWTSLKGLSMDFVAKSIFLLSAFFTDIISEKIVCDIVERKD